jgi:hypothetical protein
MAKLKYGIVDSSQTPLVPFCVGAFLASDVLSAKSGRFVVYDESDAYWRAANDGEATFNGYVEQHLTCAATSGQKLPIFDIRNHTFELPYANATSVTTQLTQANLDAMIGQLCDLHVASNIQYADAGATTDNIFRIVGGDPTQGYGTLYVQVVDTAIQDIA